MSFQDKRLDAYIRVSRKAGREGPSYMTKDIQREGIEKWAREHGAKLTAGPDDGMWEEEDVSGRKLRRKKLDEIMRRIRDRETDGIVVYKATRFGRSLANSLRLLQELDETGGLFASSSENFDRSTPSGKFGMGAMLLVAELESDTIKESWSHASRRAVARGVYIAGGLIPLGYSRREDGTLEVDGETASIVTETYHRRAAGEPWASLRDWLAGLGHAPSVNTKKEGQPVRANGRYVWDINDVRRMLAKRVYLGEVRQGEIANTSAHEALIDPVTWQAAQRPTTRASSSSTRNRALLQGLVRCAGCRYTATRPVATESNPRRSYICWRRHYKKDCPEPMGTIVALDSDHRPQTREVVAAVIELGEPSRAEVARHLGIGETRAYWYIKRAYEGGWLHNVASNPQRSRLIVGDPLPDRIPEDERIVGLDALVVREMFKRLELDEIAFEASSGTEVQEAYAAREITRSRLDAHARDVELLERMGRDAYLAQGDVLRAADDEARQREEEVLRRADRPLDVPVATLREQWSTMPLEEQQGLLKRMIQAVFVQPRSRESSVDEQGRERSFKRGVSPSRIHIVWHDEPPIDVPRQGRRDYVMRPFAFPADTGPRDAGMGSA